MPRRRPICATAALTSFGPSLFSGAKEIDPAASKARRMELGPVDAYGGALASS